MRKSNIVGERAEGRLSEKVQRCTREGRGEVE